MLLPIILSALIGIAHYASNNLCLVCSKLKKQAISLVAGISIAYLFLNLYPEFYKQARNLSPFMITSVFLGFAVFHVIDKEIYQKFRPTEVKEDIMLVHGIGLALYYIVIGIVLVSLISISTKEGVLFFIPVFIYAALSALSSHGIHGMHGPHYNIVAHLNLIQSVCIVGGALIALFYAIPEVSLIYLTGIVAGILNYVVVRDMLPEGKKGKPLLFILGALIYLLLTAILWAF